VRELEKHLGHRATIFDLLNHADELAQKDDVIIVRGEHEPIRTEERQRELYVEIGRRRAVGGRAADTSRRKPLLFSGLVYCAYCESPFYVQSERRPGRRYIYYACKMRLKGRMCENKKWIRETYLYVSSDN
jgi:hypothetical protein